MRTAAQPVSTTRSNASAFLVSLILHLTLLIAFALWVMPRQDSPLVVRLSHSVDDSANDLERMVLDQPLELPPVQTETDVRDPDLTLEPAQIDIEWSEPLAAVTAEFHFVSPDGIASQLIGATNAKQAPPPAKTLPQSFQDLITDAQKNGIDIVMVFDSTGSMGGEIMVVKNRLMTIGQMIQDKIPAARFSLVTYRDHQEQYLVRGTPLSEDLTQADYFARRIQAAGGGDEPESVRAGMEWAMRNNDFDRYRQKAMLIFGDARPHANDIDACLRLARKFKGLGKARVSTITCRHSTPIPAFYAIAREGGGDAYLIGNTNRLMIELLVSAFGQEHRQSVMEFFEVGK